MAANAEKEKLELQRLVLEHVLQRMVKVRDDYNVQLQELYFLQTGGNMMDFMAWKQRPNKHLEEFMAQNRLDEDDVPSLPLAGGATVDQTGRKREENAAKEDQNLPSVSDGDRIATGGVSAGFQAGDGLRKAQPVASAPSSQEQIAMQAKQEATVLKRVSELTNEGLWSSKRLPKVHEPARKKTHWDYLLEEMHWLATDFAQERRWKKAAARKLATSVAKLHAQRLQKEQRAEREEVTRLKRVASLVAKEIRQYWTNIEKIVQYKQDHRLAEKRQKALDMHLNFIVGQTEKYSSWLMESMSEPVGTGTASSSRCLSRELSVRGSGSELDKSDLSSESDDEATIEKEEAAPSEDILAHDAELKLLEQEATLDLDQLRSSLPSEIFSEPAKPVFRDSSDESSSEEEAEGEEECDQQKDAMDIDCQSQTEKDVSGPRTRSRSLPLDGTSAPEKDSADDKEFTVTDEMEAGEGRDDEETMEKEEKQEGTVDHNRELADLKEEGDMPIEELLKMYGQTGPASETTSAEASSLPETEEEKESDDSNDDESPEQKDGIEQLVSKPDSSDSVKGPEELNSVAAAAEQLQPTGITLDSTTVKTPVPFLLKHKLREYQHIGLDWLVTMHDKTLNGILADEMGLGKTMQTIALLAHLACDRGIWGPHLIVVPTSVVLNWEMEIKKWCPAFKILTYWGSIKERKLKRQGWTKHNTFHICITSYKLVVQDNHIFRRKKWKYFILDEAHNIKNFKSQRWQVLLNFNSQRRLLLTGTPLQNSLMELWSLMHFLMPHVFTSHQEFREWFSNPLTGMIEGSREYNESLVKRLHKVLRPFLLRRLKSEVEKQLPNKYEHVIGCRLSKRQRFLYDDFMDRTKTKETLASGNFLSVINILMQLRKVCNHPDLFETRPIVSPLVMQGITFYTASLIVSALDKDPFDIIDLPYLNVSLVDFELSMDAFAAQRTHGLQTPKKLIVELSSPESTPAGVTPSHPPSGLSNDSALPESPGIPISAYDGEDMAMFNHLASHSSRQYSTRAAAVVSSQVGESMLQSLIIPGVVERRAMTVESRQDYIHRINTRRCSRRPLYGLDTRSTLDVNKHDRGDDPFDFDSSTLGHWSWQARSHHACSLTQRTELTSRQLYWLCTDLLQQAICTPCERAQQLEEILKRFIMWIPNVENPPIVMHASHTPPSMIREQALYHTMLDKELSTLPPLLHPVTTAMKLQFPETRLIQYDCGKLQTLDRLLRQLKVDSHRVLIFTQMTRMLDILEAFLNYHGHTYFRLDGATRIDRRQQLMDHFNMDKRIFCFILSTRSGGIGVNLTGADTVIFYDSDWNPTMDAQAQDRCHRIGQTRDVSIYRLISEHTVEENILKKAKQKKLLGDLAIEGGSFTTEFFKQRDIRDIFDLEGEAKGDSNMEAMSEVADMTQKQLEETLAGAEDEQDVLAANQATAEQVAELAEFSETAIDDPQGESRAGVSEAEPELSQTEQKLAHLQKQLTPVERRCVHLVEDAMSEYMDWQLKAAENQVEHDKKNWELSHLQALKQAEELKAEEEDELMLTFAQEDIQDKCFIRLDNGEEMPIWMPPTPPEDGKDDYYTDYTLALTYNLDIMDESQLPPIYISRRNEEDGHIQKKKRLDHAAIAAAWKVNLPEVSDLRGLRERPVPLPPLSARKISDSDGKGRRQSILPSNKKLKLKIPNILSTKGSALDEVEWTISDDWALLQAVAALQELNLGLLPEYSGHTPNWGVVADVVNLQSSLYKSPPQCRDRYDHVVALREEGRLPDDYSRRLKKMKSLSHIKVNRTAKTHVQVTQDMGLTETELNSTKFDVIHSTAMKRTAVVKPSHSGVLGAGSNHAAVLEQRGVSVDSPVRPKQLAVQRADRIAMEKSTGSTSTSKREGQPQQPLNSAQPAYKVQERPVALTVSGTQLTTLLARNPMQQSVAQIGAVPHSVACLPAGTVSIAATAVQVQGAPPFIKRMAGPLTAITGQVVSVKQPGVTAALHHQPSQPLQQSARLAAQEQKAPRTLHQQQQMTALPRVSSATTVRQITTPLAILQRQPFKTSPQMIRSVHVQQLQQALRAPHVSLALTSTGQQRFTTTVSQIPSTQITPQQHQSQEQLQAKLLQAQLRQTPSPGPQQLTIQGKSIQHPSSVPTPPQAIPAVSQEGFPQVTRTLNQPHPHPQLCQSQQQQVLVRIQQPHGHQYLSQFPRVQQPIQSTLQMPLTSVTSPAPNIPQESELMLPSQADRVTPESRPPSNQPQVQSPGQAKPMAVGQQGQGQGQTRQPYSMRPRNPSRSS